MTRRESLGIKRRTEVAHRFDVILFLFHPREHRWELSVKRKEVRLEKTRERAPSRSLLKKEQITFESVERNSSGDPRFLYRRRIATGFFYRLIKAAYGMGIIENEGAVARSKCHVPTQIQFFFFFSTREGKDFCCRKNVVVAR